MALETLWFEDLGNGRTRLRTQSLVDSFEARDMFLAGGVEAGVNEGYAKLDELLARAASEPTAPPDRPAERHREIGRVFTDRVRGTRAWDAPSPVSGWVARDVVRHLVE